MIITLKQDYNEIYHEVTMLDKVKNSFLKSILCV